jgi:hypothetical protein
MTFYHCDQENCDYKTKYTNDLKRHKSNIHDIDVKWFHCSEQNCDYKSKTTSDLKRHKIQIHDIDVKWFHCSELNCESKFKSNRCLKRHKIHIHEIDVTWYKCELCEFKTKENSNLKQHKSHIHDINVIWHKCKEQNCDFRSKHISHLKRHFKSFHTKEGQARQKKEENKIKLLLEKNNIKFDREQRVNFSCFDSGKHWACIDFVLYRKDFIILLEVDENQHKYGEWYSVSCDMKRMSHIITSIRCEGKEHKILFLRYNPNSFKIEKVLQKFKQKERQEELINFINSYKPEKDTEIKYMYYDKERYEDKIPLIVKSTDYDYYMRKLVI